MQNISTLELLFGLVLIFPLASFIVSFLIPQRYSWLVSIVASLLLLGSFVLSLVLFFSEEDLLIRLNWFQVGHVVADFSLHLDSLSRLMLTVVTLVSFLIHVYSIGYMAGNESIRRYFGMLGLFTWAMLGITVAEDLLLLFGFWELVGFSSYLLIGHWMEKPEAAKAAHKAFLFNRTGDVALLIGIILIWVNTQTLSIQNIESFSVSPWLTLSGILIFCGVIAKSAQLPFFSWLPSAMEGPTPVSALLHAATMVAAGIFLLIRLFPLLTETTLFVIAVTGSVTALLGAVCALNQFDIKKILAYSTISQLGLMVTAVGLSAKDAALLHLFTHAFFKAGLFLAAGSIIHVLSHHQFQVESKFDVQDIRNLGGLKKKLPLTFLTFCITGASLAGIPFFSGFISKDSILTAALNRPDESPFRWIFIIVILIVSFCTVLYTFRMIRFIFLGPESKATLLEIPWVMRIPMIVLAFTSGWFVVSFNPFNVSGWFANSFSGTQTNITASILSAAVVLLALPAAGFIYHKKTSPKAVQIIQNGFEIDWFYQKTVGAFFLKLSSATNTIDKKWIDGILHIIAYAQVALAHGIAWLDQYVMDGIVHGGARLVKMAGSFTRSFQGGKIQLYIFWAAAGLIIFLFFTLI